MTDQELLLETARLFETATWIKGAYWSREPHVDGERISFTGGSVPPVGAICFCLFGGFCKITQMHELDLADLYPSAMQALGKAAGLDEHIVDVAAALQEWNDEPERTKGDIISALNRAAEMLA
jgi:hypothetical protein